MIERSPDTVEIRPVRNDDLAILFQHQLDPDGAEMAAARSQDLDAFTAHWTNLLKDRRILARTILYNGRTAGHIRSFPYAGKREVGYWLGRDYWGKGIASRALSAFLREDTARPLHAYVARHNPASLRVLEKCGFQIIGEDEAFTHLDGVDIAGYILELSDPPGTGREAL